MPFFDNILKGLSPKGDCPAGSGRREATIGREAERLGASLPGNILEEQGLFPFGDSPFVNMVE